MTASPERGVLLARPVVAAKERVDEGGLSYERESLPVYEVVSAGPGAGRWKAGDRIVCDSTGTELALEGQKLYLFKAENVAGRIAG